VVKLGKAFSILVVFALLILLAPAVVLLPGENVAQGNANTTQEVGASFAFTEDVPAGDWHGFTAGSNGINATYGLYLAQYTRNGVTRAVGNPLPGCEFRNYTTANGTATGDLTGTMWVSFITTKFAQQYPGTLYYGGASDFGWMMGRGHYYGGGDNDFTFVFALDFDSDAELNNAGGKGFMLGIDGTGDFAGHKIIGDFEFSKTGAAYTWNLDLRNYPPSEVHDLGWLNVTGGVVQEPTDAIHTPLAILDFKSDGPQVTPTNLTTDFEEVNWGKDPSKVVTSGHLGTGADMIVSRNTILYLELMGLISKVRIMGTTGNNIYINDNYVVTGDDGSPYGELWELLLLLIPNQILPVGQNFTQDGYTLTAFGLNASTECYAGTESYALAEINISSSLTDALQWSVDYVYGLYPTPKPTSVIPALGAPGATMDVTIKGKYFLRADGAKSGGNPSTGDVDFGSGIMVNSYTIKNGSPLGNEITANITIAGGATLGARNVTVKSCFNYSAGSGTAPYKYGILAGGFVVTGATGSVQGNVTFAGRGAAPNPKWIEPFVVKGYTPNTASVQWATSCTTDSSGFFTVGGITPGTYDIAIKNHTCLSEMVEDVVVTAGNTTVVHFGSSDLREGDIDNNDWVYLGDLSAFCAAWNSKPGYVNWNAWADLDADKWVYLGDLSLFCSNWNLKGDAYPNF